VKPCTRCGETKPLDEFYDAKGGKFGKRSRCKTCHKRASVEWAQNNRPAADAATQRWRDKNPEKVRGYWKADYWNHREKRMASAKKFREEKWDIAYAAIKRWKLENRDRVLELNAAYRERNRERLREKNRAYKKANPAQSRAQQQRRRARKAAAPGFDYTTQRHIQARIDLYGGLCAYCGAKATTIDHRIPLARGGSHWPANLLPACGTCNPSKGTKTELEFRAA
jgi:5-methylcytosine-specific restriction endonuclease McrA